MINVNFLETSTKIFIAYLSYLSLFFNSLIVGHLIGKGAFGFVYQGVAKGINPKEKVTTVAIKTVRG